MATLRLLEILRDLPDPTKFLYASSSEVIREALRAWNYQRALRQKALVELRADIQTGFNTGDAAEAGIETIIAGAKAQRKAKLARPTSNASNHAKA